MKMSETQAFEEDSIKPSRGYRFCRWLSQMHQHLLDLSTPFVLSRWTSTIFLLFVYLCRIFYLKGWYIITYGLGIYHLNLFIAFLTPKIDPARLEMHPENGPELPTKFNEEFRPFIRRLPEFKFWYSASRAIVIAMFLTCFDMFNIPVFWPVLLLYFLTLFSLTMKTQIKHMIKYKYLPWTTGKVTYKGKEDTGTIVAT